MTNDITETITDKSIAFIAKNPTHRFYNDEINDDMKLVVLLALPPKRVFKAMPELDALFEAGDKAKKKKFYNSLATCRRRSRVDAGLPPLPKVTRMPKHKTKGGEIPGGHMVNSEEGVSDSDHGNSESDYEEVFVSTRKGGKKRKKAKEKWTSGWGCGFDDLASLLDTGLKRNAEDFKVATQAILDSKRERDKRNAEDFARCVATNEQIMQYGVNAHAEETRHKERMAQLEIDQIRAQAEYPRNTGYMINREEGVSDSNHDKSGSEGVSIMATMG